MYSGMTPSALNWQKKIKNLEKKYSRNKSK